eukprot:TRINITY_DN45287_c0_g1_i1.p2 TRINITY_DN45287_c0_g1~~TRINITY_DN45287_c0_g1_i1.p2  ORF type:complete len:134 (+),score=3.51 TRINITY_DN45287_c0_g1_i1:186-587(+)
MHPGGVTILLYAFRCWSSEGERNTTAGSPSDHSITNIPSPCRNPTTSLTSFPTFIISINSETFMAPVGMPTLANILLVSARIVGIIREASTQHCMCVASCSTILKNCTQLFVWMAPNKRNVTCSSASWITWSA